MAVFQFNAKSGVWKGVDNFSLHLDLIFLCHSGNSPCFWKGRNCIANWFRGKAQSQAVGSALIPRWFEQRNDGRGIWGGGLLSLVLLPLPIDKELEWGESSLVGHFSAPIDPVPEVDKR